MDCYSQQRRSGAGFDSALTRRSSSAAAQRAAARRARQKLRCKMIRPRARGCPRLLPIAAGRPPLSGSRDSVRGSPSCEARALPRRGHPAALSRRAFPGPRKDGHGPRGGAGGAGETNTTTITQLPGSLLFLESSYMMSCAPPHCTIGLWGPSRPSVTLHLRR